MLDPTPTDGYGRRQSNETAGGRARDSYADAGRALRQSIEQALELGEGISRETRVLLGAYLLTASYSRISDRIYVPQLAAIAKIPGDLDNRHLRRSLRRWHERGVLDIDPGRGAQQPMVISLRRSGTLQPPLLNITSTATGPESARSPGQIEPVDRASLVPPTEKDIRAGLPKKNIPAEQTEASYAAPAALPDLTIENPAAAVQPDLESWGAAIEARSVERAAQFGSIERLLEVCPDADAGSLAVLASLFGQLPAENIEFARSEILRCQPRTPVRYAVGIAQAKLRPDESRKAEQLRRLRKRGAA